ncbi:hypothetical protein [Simiduia agarivorans]|uniref:Lipoprotein SmpA/OmlA domain-containing protein n=1 Tax=Simiduia agarivorans (strain DSM 21679 / JCM 13881 / BCRC 17597 / SA1) TaxID=1117647 RepID=K4KUX6_SIMAS|nr:hypothetical protein [Simiduia agarivorans]AFU97717.1 hypothetical protein M5M_02490 [Simiduia agarivorans SA1 = DSM 21679]
MLRATGVAFVICVLAGCSFVDRQKTTETRYQEVSVNPAVWASIIPGVTDEQWLLRHLGPPATIEKKQQTQIFVYPLVAQTTDRLNVFLFYNRRSVDQAYFQKHIYLEAGKVSRIETVQPVPAMVATQIVNVAQQQASPVTEPVTPSAPAAEQDPYTDGQTDPFEHPWPFGSSR